MKIKHVLAAAVTLLGTGYLYSIAPNKDRSRRKRLLPFEVVKIAHRGLFDNQCEYPENSLASFKRAMDYGFGIELDVRLTKDGVPVVFHDEDLERVCGVKKKIAECTYDEISSYTLFHSKEHIPRLNRVLELVNGKVPLIIEIKAEYDVLEICRKTMYQLYQYPGYYCIESFSPFVLSWFEKHEPNVLRGQLAMDFFKEEAQINKPFVVKFAAKNLMTNFISHPDFISYDLDGTDSIPMILERKFHEAKTAAWGIHCEEDMKIAEEFFDIIIFDGFIPKETEVEM